MKSSTVPAICCCALASMSTAALSHWWSLRQFSPSFHPDAHAVTSTTVAAHGPPPVTPANPPGMIAATAQPAAITTEQKHFYEALISKMDSLQTQNRDLLDQLAETNRDLMKLEFRVDTHSESFRPMPVSEDRPLTRSDDDVGVLPPRAAPVVLPLHP